MACWLVSGGRLVAHQQVEAVAGGATAHGGLLRHLKPILASSLPLQWLPRKRGLKPREALPWNKEEKFSSLSPTSPVARWVPRGNWLGWDCWPMIGKSWQILISFQEIFCLRLDNAGWKWVKNSLGGVWNLALGHKKLDSGKGQSQESANSWKKKRFE